MKQWKKVQEIFWCVTWKHIKAFFKSKVIYTYKVSVKRKSRVDSFTTTARNCCLCQGRLDTWARWAVARGAHEHRRPMLIRVFCDLPSINKCYTILNYKYLLSSHKWTLQIIHSNFILCHLRLYGLPIEYHLYVEIFVFFKAHIILFKRLCWFIFTVRHVF